VDRRREGLERPPRRSEDGRRPRLRDRRERHPVRDRQPPRSGLDDAQGDHGARGRCLHQVPPHGGGALEEAMADPSRGEDTSWNNITTDHGLKPENKYWMPPDHAFVSDAEFQASEYKAAIDFMQTCTGDTCGLKEIPRRSARPQAAASCVTTSPWRTRRSRRRRRASSASTARARAAPVPHGDEQHDSGLEAGDRHRAVDLPQGRGRHGHRAQRDQPAGSRREPRVQGPRPVQGCRRSHFEVSITGTATSTSTSSVTARSARTRTTAARSRRPRPRSATRRCTTRRPR